MLLPQIGQYVPHQAGLYYMGLPGYMYPQQQQHYAQHPQQPLPPPPSYHHPHQQQLPQHYALAPHVHVHDVRDIQQTQHHQHAQPPVPSMVLLSQVVAHGGQQMASPPSAEQLHFHAHPGSHAGSHPGPGPGSSAVPNAYQIAQHQEHRRHDMEFAFLPSSGSVSSATSSRRTSVAGPLGSNQVLMPPTPPPMNQSSPDLRESAPHHPSSVYTPKSVLQQNVGHHSVGSPTHQRAGASWEPSAGISRPNWQLGFAQDIKRRTKTGCMTCRRRRVKCDEHRPQCRNCMKSERVCLGYDMLFTTRIPQVEELASKRRAHRDSKKMRISSLLENEEAKANSSNNALSTKEGLCRTLSCYSKRVKVESWLKVTELCRDLVAEDMDMLLGTHTLLQKTSQRMADYLAIDKKMLMKMASELEAMRQVLIVLFPALDCSDLDIFSERLPLEKLKTSDYYYLMRAIVEAFTCDYNNQITVSPRMSKRQLAEHAHQTETCFVRLTALGRLLHYPRSVSRAKSGPVGDKLLWDHVTVVVDTVDDEEKFTEAVWNTVQYVLENGARFNAKGRSGIHRSGERSLDDAHRNNRMNTDGESKIDPNSSSAGSNNADGSQAQQPVAEQQAINELRRIATCSDPRGVLCLLALSVCGHEAAWHALSTLTNIHGLALAIAEISVVSRTLS